MSDLPIPPSSSSTPPLSSVPTPSQSLTPEVQTEQIIQQLTYLFAEADRAQALQPQHSTQSVRPFGDRPTWGTAIGKIALQAKSIAGKLFGAFLSKVVPGEPTVVPDHVLLRNLGSLLQRKGNQDIRDRLSDIISRELSSHADPHQQLQDMEQYFTSLSSRMKSEDLQPLVKRVQQAGTLLFEAATPTLKGHLEVMSAYVEAAIPSKKARDGDQSQLSTYRATPIDNRTFSYIHAEALLLGSSLEGNASEPPLSYLHNYMGANEARLSIKPWYSKLRQMIADADRIGNTLRPLESFSANVKALRPGEKTMVPAGWVGLNGRGHSIKMSVERQTDGRLTVSLYNLGAGLQNHASLVDEGVTYYQPVLDIVDVTEERLINPQFLRAYYEMGRIPTHPTTGKENNYDSKDFYGLVLNALDGTIVTCRGDSSKFMLPQYSGTCTWASCLAVLHTELDLREYAELFSEITFDSLCAFYQAEGQHLVGDSTRRLLMRECIINTSRAAIEAHRAGTISAERLSVIHDTLQEAARILEAAEVEANNKLLPDQLNLESSPSSKPITATLPNATAHAEGKVREVTPSPLPPSYSFEWLKDPRKAAEGFRDFHQHLRSLQSNGHRLHAARELENFFSLLASPVGKVLWVGIPSNHVEQVAVQLANINELLLDAQLRLPQNNRIYLTYAFFSMAITHSLSNRMPGPRLPFDKELYDAFVVSTAGRDEIPLTIAREDLDLYSPEARQLREAAIDMLPFDTQCKYVRLYEVRDSRKLWCASIYINKESHNNWGDSSDQAVIRKLIEENSELRTKIIEEFAIPEKLRQTTEGVLTYALYDLYGKALPPLICAMRRQYLVCRHLERHEGLETQDQPSFTFQIKEFPDGVSGIINTSKIVKRVSPIRDFSSDQPLQELIKDRPETIRDWLRIPTRLTTEADVMSHSLDKNKRDFALLTARGLFNEKKLYSSHQVIKALAYGLEHLELLRDHDARMMLRFLLFEGPYLEKILAFNPSIAQVMNDFVATGFEYFRSLGDIDAACFFITLGRELDALVRFVGIKSPFPDFRQSLLDVIDKGGKYSKEEITLLYQQLVASYETHPPDHFSADDAVKLITALMHCNTYPLAHHKATDKTLTDMAKAYQRFAPAIVSLLESDSGQQICQGILGTLMPEIAPQEWQCSYLRCISEDGRCVLDLSIPKIFIDQQSKTGLPNAILSHSLFRRQFASPQYFCSLVGDKCYEFTDERGLLTQVEVKVVKDHERLVIRQNIDGRWYQLVQREEFSGPQQFGSFRSLPNSFLNLCDTSMLWLSLDKENPWFVDIRNGDYHVTHQIELTPRKGSLLHDGFFLPPWERGSNPVEVTIRKRVNEEETWSLVNPSEGPLKIVCADGILWRDDSSDRLVALERDDLGLSFSIESNELGYPVAYCQEYPGYHLASNQRYHGLKAVPGALVIENAEGKRKLILPYGEVMVNELGSLSSNYYIIGKGPQSLHESMAFDLDHQLQPIPTTPEQKLYLASILLAQKEYRKAQILIRSAPSNIVAYSKQCCDLLVNIAKTAYNAQDKSPHATAVVGSAMAQLYLGSYDDKEQDGIGHALYFYSENRSKYQDQVGAIPDLRLTLEEEKNADSRYSSKKTESVDPSSLHVEESSTISVIQPLISPIPAGLELFYADILVNGVSNQSVPRTYMVTRPEDGFKRHFFEFYNMALDRSQHADLEVILLGAAISQHVPRVLISMLRELSEAVASGQPHPYPTSRQELEAIFRTPGRWNEFTALTDKLNVQKKQKERAKVGETVATGKPHRLESSKEAQTLGVRTQPIMPLSSIALSQPRPILTAKQLSRAFFSIPNGGLHLSSQDISELQEAIRGGEPSAEAEALCSHINTYWTQEKLNDSWHQLLPEQLPTVKTYLLVSHAEMGKRTKALEKELLNFANTLPKELLQALVHETEVVAHQRQRVTLEDLIVFAARPHHFTATGKNPELEDKEHLLLQMCLRYLDVKAQHQQIGRAVVAFKALENVDPTTPLYDRLSQSCYQELTRQRPYDANEFPELLVFETVEGKGLYDWQVSDLNRMLRPQPGENPNVVLEKVMGAGKTKVYLPLIALSKADGDALSLVVVHSSQYDTVGREMEINASQTFAQAAHTLHFNRDSDTSIETLQEVLNLFQKVRSNRDFLVVTDKALHNLYLAFDLMWDNYLNDDNSDPTLPARIELMREITTLLKQKGKATFDEADLLLNVRYETVYAVGNKIPIAEAHRQIVADLFESLSPHFNALTPYTEEGYAKLRPELMEILLQNVVARKLPHLDQDMIRSYMNFQEKGDSYVSKLSPNERQVLSIARYHIDELFPVVLSRRCGEHYGYSGNSDKILPVPFVASGKPDPTAEFQFPYVLLDYTLLTLQKEGPSPLLLDKIFTDLRRRAIKERTANPKLSLENTKAYQEFLTIVGNDSRLPFLNISKAEIQALAKSLKEHHPNRYEFACKYLFPDVTIHPRKITSNSYTLFNMFSEVNGFTGTPWNSDTYPVGIETLRDTQSAGKTLGIIWQNSQVVHRVSEAGARTAEELVSRIPIQSYHSYIDVSATFNGMDNREVATAMLHSLPKDILGIAFFDGNNKYVLERGKAVPTPYDQCGLSKESRFVYYDQWHTTGTDIPIGGRSLISVGKNTKIRDLEQGYMRDRQAEQDERIDFLVTDQDASFFIQRLGLPSDHILRTRDILRCLEMNQKAELQQQLMMGAFASVRAVISNHFRALRLDPNIPLEAFKSARTEFQNLISEAVKDDPYEQFGRLKTPVERERFVKGLIDSMVTAAIPLINLSQGTLTEDSVRKDLLHCFRFHLLPDSIATTAARAPEQLVEKQSIQQAQHQQLAMVHKHVETDTSTTKARGPVHWNWQSRSSAFLNYYQVRPIASLKQWVIPVLTERWETGRINGVNCVTPTINNPYRDYFELPQAPLFNMRDVFACNTQLKPFTDCFDIETSINFMPVVGDGVVPALAPQQLDVHNLLIRRNIETGVISVTLISETDAAFFYQRLAIDRTGGYDRQCEVTLYHLTLGSIQTNGRKPIDKSEFTKELVQAKFLDGQSTYSEEELPVLKSWIMEKGPAKMHDLFVNHILKHKAERRLEFENSPLQHLFRDAATKARSSRPFSSSSSES